MTEQKNGKKSPAPEVHGEALADDVEAAILAGGEIVGTTRDDEPLVEGPNSQ